MTLTLAEIRRRHRGEFFADLTGRMIKPGVRATYDGCLFISTIHRTGGATAVSKRGYLIHRARTSHGCAGDPDTDVEITTLTATDGRPLQYPRWTDARDEARFFAQMLQQPDGDQRLTTWLHQASTPGDTTKPADDLPAARRAILAAASAGGLPHTLGMLEEALRQLDAAVSTASVDVWSGYAAVLSAPPAEPPQ